MESPGALIREARRRRGLSPEEVFRLARIRPGLLEKIEEDVLSSLPEDPYARGLYASLARTVGADPERVLAAYDHLRSTRAVLAFDPARVAEPASGRGRPIGFLLAAAALILLVGIGWLAQGRARHVVRTSPGASGTVIPSEEAGASRAAPAAADSGAAVAGPMEPGGRPVVARTAESEEDVPPPPPTEVGQRTRDPQAVKVQRVSAPRQGDGGAGPVMGGAVQPLDSDTPELPGVNAPEVELVLEAAALRDTWMRVVIDTERTRSGILAAGQKRVWRGRNEIRLDLQDAASVRLRLNGRPVDVGEPRHGAGHLLMTWNEPAPAAESTSTENAPPGP